MTRFRFPGLADSVYILWIQYSCLLLHPFHQPNFEARCRLPCLLIALPTAVHSSANLRFGDSKLITWSFLLGATLQLYTVLAI
jgi:hypothetical protein